MLGKNANTYAQAAAPGTIDQLVDVLRDKYHRPIPGADLLMSNIYDQLMPEVVDAKDLGSGVIDGVECDHLAFRTKDVDWQIWIAQGGRPYPCRYVITSTKVSGAPQYTIDVRAWKTGAEVASAPFAFKAPANAKKLNPGELQRLRRVAGHLFDQESTRRSMIMVTRIRMFSAGCIFGALCLELSERFCLQA